MFTERHSSLFKVKFPWGIEFCCFYGDTRDLAMSPSKEDLAKAVQNSTPVLGSQFVQYNVPDIDLCISGQRGIAINLSDEEVEQFEELLH